MSGYNNNLYAFTDVRSIDGWREYIAGGRSKDKRPVANNTTARLIFDGVAIRLHDTDIVIMREGHGIELSSGGWLTVTTKDRINRYTKAGIWQERGVWYINDANGNKTLFYDGMLIDNEGNPLKPRPTEKYEREVAKIKKQAKEYARGFVEALKAGTIDYPNGGDCWACLMKGPKGQEAFEGSGHIQMHMKDKYYVPSLLVNAARAAGYRDEQIGLMGIGGQRLFIEPERVLYRYIVKNLQGALK